MKFFYRKFLAAFVFLVFAFNAKAVNDTLTIGQAFNWKVGDTLVYRPFRWCDSFTGYNAYQIGFEVMARTSFPDSILYSIQYFGNSNLDTMLFINLDSTVTGNFKYDEGWHINCFDLLHLCPMPYCPGQIYFDSNFYNYLTISRYFDFGEVNYSYTASERVGLRHIEMSASEYCYGFPYGRPGGCGSTLIYYHSDTITWMDSTLYFYNSITEPKTSPSFHLFPNPATDELTVTTETEGTYSVSVYDVMGNCVSAPKNFSDNLFHIKVNHLSQGYYYLKLTDGHSNATTKSFIVAR